MISCCDFRQATARYIDSLGADNLEKAAQYTVGNHWLLLWGLVVTAFITWLVVRSGVLDRLQARLERRGFAMRAFLVSAAYLLISGILALPWSIYEGWWREHAYDRSSQPLGDFLLQNSIAGLITVLVGGLFLLYRFMKARRTQPREHVRERIVSPLQVHVCVYVRRLFNAEQLVDRYLREVLLAALQSHFPHFDHALTGWAIQANGGV